MKLQTDRKIEIIRVVQAELGVYRDALDPNNPDLNAPAIIESREFAPDIAVKPCDLLLIKVLE